MVSYTREVKKMKKTLISGVTVAMVVTAVMVNAVHGLTFSQDIGVSFTFNSVVGMTLSASDLIIPSLAPGTAADSNIIDINILTNSTNGYTLNASVGNNTTYDTRSLVHVNNTVTNTFSSVDFGSSIASNTSLSDNTWAYSYSTDNGANWANYSGLPLYSDTTNVAQLKNSTTPVSSASGDNIKFKIAAKASNTQASGEYRNVINFQLTATPLPTTLSMAYENAGKEKHNGYFKLQDMTADICNAAEVVDEGSQMQAIDTRDNKVYWITKLRDGKCWFTQNLDLDLDADRTYTHADTDLGWGSDTATVSWKPIRSTINASNVTDNNIPNWADDYNTPYSVDPGNVYWNNTPFYTSTNNLFLNNDWGSDPVKFRKTTPFDTNGTHGHVGNYYNWSAAVASNDTSSYTTSTYSDISGNPQNSICPAGWRLPTITGASPTYIQDGSMDEFTRLANLYASYTGSNNNINSQGLDASPLYLVRGGSVYSRGQVRANQYGNYWVSTVGSRSVAFGLDFNNTGIIWAGSRETGFSVRCVAR